MESGYINSWSMPIFLISIFYCRQIMQKIITDKKFLWPSDRRVNGG